MKQPRFIISGGGTGGHIFPAISIANTIKAHVPDAEILFVGAENRMEMEKVPAAGYKITGLPVSGLKRSLNPENIKVVINLFRSIRMAKKIIADFKPDAVIGVGGYASAPVLYAAAKKGIPTLIQEQNSYAGVTNKILGKKVDKVCVAYDGMEKFFPAAKIVKTGNPVRQQLALSSDKRDEAYGYFNFDPSKKTLLVVGGSLGARTINQSVLRKIDLLYKNHAADMQVIWQTGKFYIDEIREAVKNLDIKNMYITDFVSRMDLAYCIADLVISRAGASSISELSLLGKASILVPSPNVAEDHQTKNALALKNRNAAELIPDREARDRLVQESIRIVNNEAILSEYRRNIKYFSRPDAAEDIVSEVFALAGIEFVKKKKHETAKHAAHKTEKKNDTHGSIAEERETPANYYFLGIGGIGMSAIARYLKRKGNPVAGYDLTESPLTCKLEKEGINIHYTDNINLVPVTFMDSENTTVIYTPAVPENMKEFQFFKKSGFRMIKRSQALGLITEGKQAVCVAGSHGKTTTTTMITHLLDQGKAGVNAFLGGISKNYGSNLVVSDKSETVVVEADEYDRSFLQLKPYIAVITATDSDHLDIYGSREKLLEAFSDFCSLIRSGGSLIYKKGIELDPKTVEGVKVYTYSKDDKQADFHAENIVCGDGATTFDFVYPGGRIDKVGLGAPAPINVENATAAMAVAKIEGVDDDGILQAMASFQGVARRFDTRIKTGKVVYIDDYAHHPKEISAAIASIKQLYPGKKICGVFQPHLYSRTRDFYKEFAESLSVLDTVVLLDIYPARELPIEGVSSSLILDNITAWDKCLATKQNLLKVLDSKDFDVLLTLGAGDIDRLVPQIENYLKNKNV